jgi:predicted Zn-dependent peptidase
VIAVERLDSGLACVTERVPDVRSVAVGFWVAVGSRDEDDRLAGASHFLEHLLFKGTPTRTARDIAEAIDAVGGEMNAFTTKEYTAFYVRVLDGYLDLALDILSDIMWSPAFRPDDIEAERQVILEEILMHEDEPADLVHDVFCEGLFPRHPLGREILGTTATITGMSRDDIRGYFARHYRPANIVVAAAGRLDHGAVAEGVAARFCGLAGGEPPARADGLPPHGNVAVCRRPTEQAHLVVGMRALPRDDPDRYALAVVDHVLGGGMSSRLFQEIRENRGLAYSVYSFRNAFVETGSLAAYAGTAPNRAREVVALIHAELDRLAAEGITEEELAAAKGHLTGSLALGMEDTSARMNRIGRAMVVHGEVETLDEVVGRIEAVTPDDCRRVIDRVLTGERLLAVVGPFDPETVAAWMP